MKLSPGDVVAGKYRIDRFLRKGGMGRLFVAYHLQLGVNVAIKAMLPVQADDDVSLVDRFSREARAAVRLKSEHSARVLDVGTFPDGSPYMVMEYLEGEDLRSLVARDGALQPAQAVGYVVQACEAIAEAHSLGIVHRDLKPANLFLVRRSDGTRIVKVLDFGLAKMIDTGGDLTQTQTTMGSPRYMSPEQIKSFRNVDLRTDIWALGACLYELLTGRAAFDAESTPAIYVSVLTEEPTPPHVLVGFLPEGLSQIVMRCLVKNPDERYQDVGELAQALARYVGTENRMLARRVDAVLSERNSRPKTTAEQPRPIIDGTSETRDKDASASGAMPIRGIVVDEPADVEVSVVVAAPRKRLRIVIAAAAVVGIAVSSFVVRLVTKNAPVTSVPETAPSNARPPPSASSSASLEPPTTAVTPFESASSPRAQPTPRPTSPPPPAAPFRSRGMGTARHPAASPDPLARP